MSIPTFFRKSPSNQPCMECYTRYVTHPLPPIFLSLSVKRAMRVTHVVRVISHSTIPGIIFVMSVMHVMRVMHVTRVMSPTPFSLV